MAAAGGGSFKERTFADFDIDPLSLDAEGNEKVLDLIEENNTLTHAVSNPVAKSGGHQSVTFQVRWIGSALL